MYKKIPRIARNFNNVILLVTFSVKRTSKVFEEEQLTGHCRHIAGGDPSCRTVTESHPEAHALPLHTTVEYAVASADDVVSLQEEAGADCVRTARNEGCT